ncbi:unnamed protein product, partial [Urochloa humidicola]
RPTIIPRLLSFGPHAPLPLPLSPPRAPPPLPLLGARHCRPSSSAPLPPVSSALPHAAPSPPPLDLAAHLTIAAGPRTRGACARDRRDPGRCQGRGRPEPRRAAARAGAPKPWETGDGGGRVSSSAADGGAGSGSVGGPDPRGGAAEPPVLLLLKTSSSSDGQGTYCCAMGEVAVYLVSVK